MPHKKRTRISASNPARSVRQRNFARNISRAIQIEGWTTAEAAEKWGVKDCWVRRAKTAGILFKKSHPSAEKIAAYYGCDAALLWATEFTSVSLQKSWTEPPIVEKFRVVLAHYSGQSKPDRLRFIIEALGEYYSFIKDGKDPEEFYIADITDRLKSAEGSQAATVSLLVRAIQDVSRSCGEEISDFAAVDLAEHYCSSFMDLLPPISEMEGYLLGCGVALKHYRETYLKWYAEAGLVDVELALPDVKSLAHQARDQQVRDSDGLLKLLASEWQRVYCKRNKLSRAELEVFFARIINSTPDQGEKPWYLFDDDELLNDEELLAEEIEELRANGLRP